MPSTTALFTGLSGLTTNSRRLDVIGNNIANVNTTAFKSNRMVFEPTFSRNFNLGTSPTGETGGTNPMQVGLGATIGGTQRNFNNGAISSTGVPTDVAIEGGGFFITEFGGEQFYTRAGNFQLNESSELVSIDGARVRGYGVDDLFQVNRGTLQELSVPVGTLTVAEATRNTFLRGNLNASGTIATTGSTHVNSPFYTDSALGAGDLLTDPNLDLTQAGNDLYISDGAGGSFLAIEGGAGTIITVDGAEKGGKEIESRSFAFSSTAVAGTDDNGTTLQDFMDFLDDVLGLDNSDIDGEMLGGGTSFSDGVITVAGNEGTGQQLALESGDFVATNNGSGINQPLVMSKTGDADGESVRTSFVVYDSLGSPLTIDLTMVLQDTQAGTGTTWTYVAESSDNDDVDRVVGLGTLQFDTTGQFVSASNSTIQVERDNGAVSPLTATLNWESDRNTVTALTSTSSTLASVFQDGSPVGTLSSFAIAETGVITGTFTNGLTRDLGQIALAGFANPAGLIDAGNGNFRVGPNSGEALITAPLEFGTGRVIGGALELSNVDLSQEFIDMILASTGYSAASRVITTTDELLDQLLILGR